MIEPAWFQWSNGTLHFTNCRPGKCENLLHYHVYWAWDRSIGGWVHYRA